MDKNCPKCGAECNSEEKTNVNYPCGSSQSKLSAYFFESRECVERQRDQFKVQFEKAQNTINAIVVARRVEREATKKFMDYRPEHKSRNGVYTTLQNTMIEKRNILQGLLDELVWLDGSTEDCDGSNK